jgi:zinc transporter ZupT
MATPFDNVVATILQGVVVTAIGLVVYQTGYRWFKNIGSNQFSSKEGAQVTIVAFLFATGFLSDPIFQTLQSLTLGWDMIQEIGIVAIASRVLVNGMVSHWRPDDSLSILIYIVGAAMFFHEQLPVV